MEIKCSLYSSRCFKFDIISGKSCNMANKYFVNRVANVLDLFKMLACKLQKTLLKKL